MSDQKKPDASDAALKIAFEWAESAEDNDTLADAYLAICQAIGSIEKIVAPGVSAVTESRLLNHAFPDPSETNATLEEHEIADEPLFEAADHLNLLIYNLFENRDRMALLINEALNKQAQEGDER
ncbi:hypothetical protein [Vreelandella indica]|uniref:hypothetical protein n=1 Tax=Vreelandella indica TaxID=3126500 RepID=UPI00300E1815